MGIGKQRYQSLYEAARTKQDWAPFDLRYVQKKASVPTEKRQKVFDFLHELWSNVAEPIPDGLNSNKRPRRGDLKFDGDMSRENIRHLPAGSIADYHRQCVATLKDNTISKKLFSDDLWLKRFFG